VSFTFDLRSAAVFVSQSHAVPMPCHDQAVLKATSHGNDRALHENGMTTAWEWHAMCELASAVIRQHVGDVPAFGFFRLPRGVPRSLLNCRTSSSNISAFHAHFHEGHGTLRECHVHGMACANYRTTRTAGERHGMCELAIRVTRICL
jgi:hypothetical protein